MSLFINTKNRVNRYLFVERMEKPYAKRCISGRKAENPGSGSEWPHGLGRWRGVGATARRGLTIDLLVNNAGFGTHGSFETIAPERDQQLVMLNIATVVALSHAFLPAMAARGEGAVINVGSMASFQPVQYMPVYGASKAFVLSFSVALAEEYRRRGVRILALCPGAT